MPWATLPRVPIEWPSAWTRPTPVPLAWPTPARCEAISICERASRSEPSATARRSHVPTVRITPSAIASANGFGLAERSDSSECVIASIPVAAVAAGGRPTVSDGSEMVATGRASRMADVALAPGRLVGDDAERVGLGAGAGGGRDGDERPTGGEVGAVVFEAQHRQRLEPGDAEQPGGHRRPAGKAVGLTPHVGNTSLIKSSAVASLRTSRRTKRVGP